MKNEKSLKRKWEPSFDQIRMGFTLSVFLIIFLTICLFAGLELLFEETGWLKHMRSAHAMTIVICAVASMAISGFSTYFMLHLPMKPVKKLLYGMTRLANGHFEERMDFGDEIHLKEMADTFNSLAEELQNMAILRADFVNNFSHEFKTPIVSIRGFAKMLQRKELTQEQREQYVNVIVEESARLAGMATQVMNLTRVETQNILESQKEYNLSEQLRHCILLMEKQWQEKELAISADFDEVMIWADQEMLQQAWVNLLDNAVKFSPRGGEIEVRITGKDGCIEVEISNQGPKISDEERKRMFDKFWQGDTSHASKGVGIGLSVVRRIVELHQGGIEVQSNDLKTTFTVSLPEREE